MLNLSTQVVRSPNQLSGNLDDAVVLLSVANGEYYKMNEVGSRIWALIEQPLSVGALVDTLLGEFEVEPSACEQEVQGFLEQLSHSGLLRVVADPERAVS
jgi:hypothetical protein